MLHCFEHVLEQVRLFAISVDNLCIYEENFLLNSMKYDIFIVYKLLYSLFRKCGEVAVLKVSYKKLWKMLIDRDMKKKEFRDFVGISYSTMSKLEKGENTTVEVLEKICLKLGCGIDDIMEIIPDSPNNGTGKSVE